MKIINACASLAIAASCSFVGAHTQPALPDGVSAADWLQIESQIQAQIQAQRFHVQADETATDGWYAANPRHGFQIDYRPDGQTVLTLASSAASGEGSHRIALQLEGYGYGDTLIELNTAPALSANGNTLTYQWKPGLREWWINNEQGVAQWFELAERPAVAANGQPLVVAMQLDTGLQAEVANNRLSLSSSNGKTAITYDRLKVWDATGRILPAEMVLNENRLALQVDDRHAVYPVTIDPTFAQQAYLKASNTGFGDFFGGLVRPAIAISGNTLVVGAVFEDSNPALGNQTNNNLENSGAAYVFVRDWAGNWSQQAFLKPSNTDASDLFGAVVAIDGDRIVVGAPQEDGNAVGGPANNGLLSSGAAYVFERTGGGWLQTAYLKAFNPDFLDRFGEAVAVSGDTIVVTSIIEQSSAQGIGGNQADNSGAEVGAAYVFVLSGGNWVEQAYIKASNAGCNDSFGDAVALDGNTLVVGAPNEGNTASCGAFNGPPGSGAAYVFVRDGGGNWTEQARLKATDPDERDSFGRSVALDGNIVIVGAPLEDGGATGVNGDQFDNSAEDSGAAYVFVRFGSNWSPQAYLKSPSVIPDALFGFAVAVSGHTVFVGARDTDGGGRVYPFTLEGISNWTPQPSLVGSNTEDDDGFGAALSVSGDLLVVAAPFEQSNATGVNGNQDNNSASNAGAVYVFSRAFTIGGTVSGLAGSGLVLQNNGGDDLNINANGAFTFDTALSDGAAYAVTVAAQPTGYSQTCTVSGGTGVVSGTAVTNVQINCVTNPFTIGGTVSDLSGSGLVLQNNAGDDLAISADGAFTFPTALDDGSTYSVTVASQPGSPSQTCTVGNGSGTLNGANVTNVDVSCVTDQFSIGGTISGLSGSGLVLLNNGASVLTPNTNGSFTFPLQDDGSSYAVIVLSQPVDQSCTVSNGSGVLAGANITNIEIRCVLISGINILPEVLDFREQLLGIPTVPLMAVVESTGPGELMLGSITLDGPQAADFQITLDSCSNVTLPVDDACGIEVVFTAGGAGVRRAWIDIPSNASSSPGRVLLIGTNDVLFRDGFEFEPNKRID